LPSDGQVERIAVALENIADAWESLAKLGQAWYDKIFPQVEINPVTVQDFRRPQQDEHPELAKPGEDIFEGLWPRERKLAEKRFAKQKIRGASQARN
jgi:hypothetical protein